MPRSLLGLFLLATVSVAPSESLAEEVDVAPLAADLGRPSAVAYLPRDGDLHPAVVLVADREARRVLRFSLDDQNAIESRDVLLGDLDDGPTALGPLGRGVLLVGGASISAYDIGAVGSGALLQRIREEGIGAECRSITLGPERVFAIFGRGLYRAQYADKLGALRPFEAGASLKQRGLAMSDRGYLLAICEAGAAAAPNIAYYDPWRHKAQPILARCEGLNDPIAIAFGSAPEPVERRLYALQEDGGLCRIDAALPESGTMQARAQPIVTVQGAVAMCAGAAGEIYVVTNDQQRGGQLFRLKGRL